MSDEEREYLTEEEEAALNAPDTNEDETGTTTEEKVETQETSPPETEAMVEAKVEPTEEQQPQETETVQPQPEGVLAKDGKNLIPISVLQQERARRQQLEAELAELRKPKPEVTEAKPEHKGVDFQILGQKLYESPEGAAEALKMVYEEGAKMAQELSQKSSFEIRFQEKVDEIKAQNPWLTGPVEELAFNVAKRKVSEMPDFNLGDLNAWVKVANEAVQETKKLIKFDTAQIDLEVERKKIRDEVTQEIMKKFNITPVKPTTLSGVRNVSPDIISKFDQLKALSGVEFEEAYQQLTPQEQETFLRE